MSCSSCGHALRPGDRFCRACGHATDAAGAAVTPTRDEGHTAPAQRAAFGNPRRRTKLVVPVGVVALVLVALAVLVASGKGPDQAAHGEAPGPARDEALRTSGVLDAPPPPGRGRATTERATHRPSPSPRRPYETSLYSLDVPSSWVRDSDAVDRGAYSESHWHLRGHPDVYFLVDVTAGYDRSARTGAQDVRKLFDDVDDYQELGFDPRDVADRAAWQWRFRLLDRDVQKVDTFLTGCGNGYALLGAAPISRFDDYDGAFTKVLESMRLSCER